MQTTIKKLRYPLLLISGILAALGVVYPQFFGALAWIALVPMGMVLLSLDSKPKLGRMYLYGLAFYYIYYVFSYHWFISMYPMDFADFTPGVAAGVISLAIFGISALQGALSALMFLVFGLFCRTAALRRYPLLKPLLFACLWVVNEWSQTIGWTGLPWSRLYLSQCELLPMAQSASLLGGLFVSFIVVTVNLCLAGVIVHAQKRLSFALLGGCLFVGNLLFGFAAMAGIKGNALPWQIGFLVTALMTVVLAAVCGLWRKLNAEPGLVKSFLCIGLMFCILSSLAPVFGSYVDDGKQIKAAALQGNLSSKDKWADDSGWRSFNVYADLSEQAVEQGADLIMWPETALAYTLFNADPQSPTKAPLHVVHELVDRLDTTVMVSTFVPSTYFDPDVPVQSTNAVIVFYPDNSYDENIYAKRKLVPFGEYVPWRDFLLKVVPALGEINMLSSDLAKGERHVSVDTKTLGVSVGPIVCFDSIYEETVRQTVKAGAQIITLSTNDSWFSDSAAVYMHNNQAIFRAIENGRYLVRAANTGVSSIVAPDGEVLGVQDALTTGMVIADVRARDVQTPYAQVGYLLVWLCFGVQGILLVSEIIYVFVKRYKKTHKA